MNEKIESLYIDFDEEVVEINGKRFMNPISVGMPARMEPEVFMHQMLMNAEGFDGKTLVPRIEITFTPGDLRELSADEGIMVLQQRAFNLLKVNLQASGAINKNII